MRADADLPVAITLPQPLLGEVAAWVEGDVGWQLVSPEGPPAPALVLTDTPRSGQPCVVVVSGMPSGEQVRAGLGQGALDVVGWPHERDRLVSLADAGAPELTESDGPTHLRIGGAAGGVGTSTVCLAIGGLLAWAGLRVLVVGDDDLLRLCGYGPWTGPGAVEMATLRAADARNELPGLCRPVAGVDGLAVLGGGGSAVASTVAWPVGVVVADVRTPPSPEAVDLVVARPDGALQQVANSRAPVLLVGAGSLDRRGAQQLLGRAPAGWLAASARVARAGLAGRVPSSLPGSWLSALDKALRSLRTRPGIRTAV